MSNAMNTENGAKRLARRAGRLVRRCSRTCVLAVALVFLLAGCVTDPITGRKQFVGLSFGGAGEDQINQLGAQAYQQTLGEAQVLTSGPQVDLVRAVGERIAPVVDEYMREQGRETFAWEFNVIESNQVNAWCLPGGKVAFYTGILPICQDEAGIAVVMGHEIAHAYGQHGRSRMARSAASEYGLGAVAAALGGAESSISQQVALQALGLGAQLGSLKFGRGDESHADELGLIFMAKAGYDPRAAVKFWERMADASGGGAPPEFLSTHPSHDTRISDLNAQMERAVEIYEQNRR